MKTLTSQPLWGSYVWTPDSRETVDCGKNGITYTDIQTGKKSKVVRVPRKVSIVDLSADGKWFIFEIRDYLGSQYYDRFPVLDGWRNPETPQPSGAGRRVPSGILA